MPRTGIQHPARIVPLAFLAVICIGTVLLMLPGARAGDSAAPFMTALFTFLYWVAVAGLAWLAFSVLVGVGLAFGCRFTDRSFDRHWAQAHRLTRADCECGDQSPRGETWLHSRRLCAPEREWVR